MRTSIEEKNPLLCIANDCRGCSLYNEELIESIREEYNYLINREKTNKKTIRLAEKKAYLKLMKSTERLANAYREYKKNVLEKLHRDDLNGELIAYFGVNQENLVGKCLTCNSSVPLLFNLFSSDSERKRKIIANFETKPRVSKSYYRLGNKPFSDYDTMQRARLANNTKVP